MKRKREKRDPWLDNLKGLLIILVVLGHLDAPLVKSSPELKVFYLLINSFHMPCFMMISGFLAKRKIDERDYRGMFYQQVLPYFMIDLTFWLFVCIFPHGLEIIPYVSILDPKPLVPKYHLWYLFAVMVYHLVTPAVVKRFHGLWSGAALLIFFGCTLLAGFTGQIQGLKFTKILTFYPFFLLGYYFPKNWLFAFRSRLICKLAAIPILAFWISFFIQNKKYIYSEVFYLVKPYAEYPKRYMKYLPPVWQRCIFLIASVVVSLAVMSLMTKHWTPLAYLGRRSRYTYILHGFFILGIRAWNSYIYPLYDLVDTGQKILFLQLGGVLFAFLLASLPFTWLFGPLIEPQLTGIFEKKEP